jgi:hypothetical protein
MDWASQQDRLCEITRYVADPELVVYTHGDARLLTPWAARLHASRCERLVSHAWDLLEAAHRGVHRDKPFAVVVRPDGAGVPSVTPDVCEAVRDAAATGRWVRLVGRTGGGADGRGAVITVRVDDEGKVICQTPWESTWPETHVARLLPAAWRGGLRWA